MFNIITPTYNRSHTLHRVYESLKNQTFKDFIWIIVDDGSTDDTKSLVENWMTNLNIKIEYYILPKNQGKATAVNFGVKKCTKPYTIIADSDDTFKPYTLELYRNIWNVANSTSNMIGSIWTLVVDDDNRVKGDKFPKDFWQVDFQQRVLNLKHQLQGDKWHCWKTVILLKYPFYSHDGCHIGESHTWNLINMHHDFLCINIPLLKAHYTDGSLLNSGKSRKELSVGYYYSSYYALNQVKFKNIIFYKYYQDLAFEYIKSKIYFYDKKLKLSYLTTLICFIIFSLMLPQKLYLKRINRNN